MSSRIMVFARRSIPDINIMDDLDATGDRSVSSGTNLSFSPIYNATNKAYISFLFNKQTYHRLVQIFIP